MMNQFEKDKISGQGDISNLIIQENNGFQKAPKRFYHGDKQHLAPLIVNNNLCYEHSFDLCLALPLFLLFPFLMSLFLTPSASLFLFCCCVLPGLLSFLPSQENLSFSGLLSFFLSRGQ